MLNGTLTNIFATYFNDSHQVVGTVNQCLKLVPNADVAKEFCGAVATEIAKIGPIAATEAINAASQLAAAAQAAAQATADAAVEVAASTGLDGLGMGDALMALKTLAMQQVEEHPAVAAGMAVAGSLVVAYATYKGAKSCCPTKSSAEEKDDLGKKSTAKPK